MKKVLFTTILCVSLSLNLFATKRPMDKAVQIEKILKIEKTENYTAVLFGCSVYIAWHDSHGSYSHTWHFSGGCYAKLDELLYILRNPYAVENQLAIDEPIGEFVAIP